jgi:hypothetical protein
MKINIAKTMLSNKDSSKSDSKFKKNMRSIIHKNNTPKEIVFNHL